MNASVNIATGFREVALLLNHRRPLKGVVRYKVLYLQTDKCAHSNA